MLRAFKRLLPGFILCLFGLVTPLIAQAFSVSPAIVEVSVDPGKQTKGIITVKNDETIDQNFYLSIQKFQAQGDKGQQSFLPPSDSSGLPSWISVDTPAFTLAPGQVRLVGYAITPPRDAMPGGYYAALFVSNRPPVTNQQNVMMGARTGVLMFVTVSGNIKRELQLQSFTQDPVSSNHWLIQMQNTGTVHLAPTGTIEVTNLFGQTVASIPWNEAQGRILPRMSRQYEAIWDPKSQSQTFFNEGPLTVTLHENEFGLTAEDHLWRFPWKTSMIVLAIIILLLIVFRKRK